jgi:hypothetical protein
MVGSRVKKLIIRKQRSFSLSQIGEDHSACFLAGISGMTDRIPVRAAARLSRLL